MIPLQTILTLADLDDKYGGLITIKSVFRIAKEFGVSKANITKELLRAEKSYVVDLKTANDPRRVSAADCIKDGNRLLQFVVVR